MFPNPRVRRVAVYSALGTAVAGALAGAFCAGLLFGRGERSQPRSVVDQASDLIRSRAQADPSSSALDAAAIRGMLAALDDKWAAYYGVGEGVSSAKSLQALLSGQYSGLGVWLRRDDDTRQIVVASVTAGSPAASAGLRVGDRIVAVDGHDLRGSDADDIAASLRGSAGTTAQLEVMDSAGATREVPVQRVDLPASPVTTDVLAPGVVRIRIATFSDGVGAQVAAARRMALAEGAKAIVLDLRGNPGGLLDEAVNTASVFLDGGPVVTLEGRAVTRTVREAAAGGDTRTPLAVLIDGGTASAAEVLAGALGDRGRAVIVGSKSFGKGSVQQTTTLADGSVLELTVATYRTPSGHTVDGTGIAPDIQIDPSAPSSVASSRAVALLQALAGN